MSASPKPVSKNVKCLSVRLSFPALFEAKGFPGEPAEKAKFGATLLLDKTKNADTIRAVKAECKRVALEKWGSEAKTPKTLKICLRDGSEKADTDGYGDDVMFFSASSKSRPAVVDKNLAPLAAQDGKPYAGCYVNASVSFWAQDNKFGKRVNAQLRAIQFIADGQPFGEKAVDVNEEFEAISDVDGAESPADESVPSNPWD